MKTTKLTRALYISALGLTLGLTGAQAVADEAAKHRADDAAHMQGEKTPQQKRDEQMRRESEAEATNPESANGELPIDQENDVDANNTTRHVPGAPDKGKNPATEPGTDR